MHIGEDSLELLYMDFALCIRHAYLGLSSTCSDTLETTCVWTKHLMLFFFFI
jgi:hypothetical protein